MQETIVPVLYTVGVLSCVFHLANGVWTMGITWGSWTAPPSQSRASVAWLLFGPALAVWNRRR